MDYKTFKNEVSNLKAYYRSAEQIETDLELLWYELTGVKGIQYDKQPSSYNQSLSENYRLELLDKIEQKEKELDYTRMVIDHDLRQLNHLPSNIRELVELIFIQGKTFAEVGKMVGYSDRGLHYIVKREIEKL